MLYPIMKGFVQTGHDRAPVGGGESPPVGRKKIAAKKVGEPLGNFRSLCYSNFPWRTWVDARVVNGDGL